MANSIYGSMTAAEKSVADYLKELGIFWDYEIPVYVEEGGRPRLWSPDFFLPELGIYIEVAASGNIPSYTFREKIYNECKVSCIFVWPYRDTATWKKKLNKELIELHQYRWSILKKLS
ncbi:hypothetical protein CJD36_003660 [Flavipsychrobacter stenotrophus]|uniref:Uncharacterized protein n=1 Tax=Flavipsychrobacter stenotrophus TaxID=2077091 RepID=A0A2S7T1W0_9BACT|nr:hypothetical protein [Flavipsychrobacter stenotrophus]PQJ12851.1 hypothetical protein CJD36_003660 [Flavipsychrobacter stenotrophus]